MTANAIGSSYPFATADYADDSVTYAKIQNVGAGKLLGNSTGGAASPEEITPGAGLTLAAGVLSASGSLSYATVSGTSQAAAVNNGYIANNAALCTVTLPSTAAVGDVVEVQGLGAGGWRLAQNASQLVRGANGIVTTTGTGGSLSSTNQYDFVRVRCIVTNTTWMIQSVISTGLTVA